MRICLECQIPKLPILYRNRFMSLIKEILSESNNLYKEKIYPKNFSSNSKIAKPFSFCVLFPKEYSTTKETFKIDESFSIMDTVFYFPKNSYIQWIISSFDYEFIINLLNGLNRVKSYNFGNNLTLKINKIRVLSEKQINSSSVAFKTISPALIEDKNDKPIFPEDDLKKFNLEFNIIHDKILKDLRGHGLKNDITFTPIQVTKKVVKHTLKDFREKTKKPYMLLTGFEGTFRLNGNPEDLAFIYQGGVGLRTGQGFGFVDICKS